MILTSLAGKTALNISVRLEVWTVWNMDIIPERKPITFSGKLQ